MEIATQMNILIVYCVLSYIISPFIIIYCLRMDINKNQTEPEQVGFVYCISPIFCFIMIPAIIFKTFGELLESTARGNKL